MKTQYLITLSVFGFLLGCLVLRQQIYMNCSFSSCKIRLSDGTLHFHYKVSKLQGLVIILQLFCIFKSPFMKCKRSVMPACLFVLLLHSLLNQCSEQFCSFLHPVVPYGFYITEASRFQKRLLYFCKLIFLQQVYGISGGQKAIYKLLLLS